MERVGGGTATRVYAISSPGLNKEYISEQSNKPTTVMEMRGIVCLINRRVEVFGIY